MAGYRYTLAAIVVASVCQILMGIFRAGKLSAFFPTSVARSQNRAGEFFPWNVFTIIPCIFSNPHSRDSARLSGGLACLYRISLGIAARICEDLGNWARQFYFIHCDNHRSFSDRPAGWRADWYGRGVWGNAVSAKTIGRSQADGRGSRAGRVWTTDLLRVVAGRHHGRENFAARSATLEPAFQDSAGLPACRPEHDQSRDHCTVGTAELAVHPRSTHAQSEGSQRRSAGAGWALSCGAYGTTGRKLAGNRSRSIRGNGRGPQLTSSALSKNKPGRTLPTRKRSWHPCAISTNRADKALVGNRGYRKYLQAEGAKFTTTATSFSSRRVTMENGCCVPTQNCPRKKPRSSTSSFSKPNRCFLTANRCSIRGKIFHQCDETIRGHVFCSFLALILRKTLLERLERLATTSNGPMPSATSMLCNWFRSRIRTSASTSAHRCAALAMQCSVRLSSRFHKPYPSFRKAAPLT